MFDSLKARFILIFGLAAICVWMLVQNGITLGLDLQGGTHLALEVADPNETLNATQRADAIDRALKIIRTRVNELGVAEPTIQKAGAERILVDLPGANAQEQQRAKDVIQKTAFLKFQIVQPASDLVAVMPRLDRVVAERFATAPAAAGEKPGEAPEAPSVVGGLFEQGDSGAAAAPDTAASDSLAAPGAAAASDSAAAHPFSSKLQPTGEEGIFAVMQADVPAVQKYLASPEVRALLPHGTELRWGVPEPEVNGQPVQYRRLYLLETRPLMTGEYLEDAQAQRDPQFNKPIVTFQLSHSGGRIFGRGTGQHVGDLMAIVLDEKVFSAPVINSQISDRGQIEMGGGSIEEARDLALVLRAGALPAPIKIVEERTVGPSLGSDSIEKGELAGVIGVIFVVAIMVGYYKKSGVMAVAALVIYVLLTLGSLSLLDAVLTMPGIAGLVLSVGMAVDANVLIFERIREELELGRSARVAVNEGFSNAMSSIIDSQVTTLITAAVLFEFGTGPIRGFAVTLSLGIIAGLFTAIFVTRTFVMFHLSRRPAARELSI